MFIKVNNNTYNYDIDLKKFNKVKFEKSNVVWGKNWDLKYPITTLRHGYCEYNYMKKKLKIWSYVQKQMN